MKKNRFRTICVALVASVLALGVCFGLSGCQESDEDKIKDVVNSEYSQTKDVTDDELKDGLGSSYDELEQYGVDPRDFWDALFQNFEYKITDVTVDGDVGTVTLEVTNIDIETGLNNWSDAINEYASSDQAVTDYNDGGEDALMTKIMGMLIDELNADDLEVKTSTVTIDVEKDSTATGSSLTATRPSRLRSVASTPATCSRISRTSDRSVRFIVTRSRS